MSETGTEEKVIAVQDVELLQALFGPGDRNLKSLQQRFGVDLVARDGGLKVLGEPDAVRDAASAIQRAIHVYQRDRSISEERWRHILEEATGEKHERPVQIRLPRGVRPRSKGQDVYLSAIERHGITFGVGPAGTGKTFLAAAVAVAALQRGAYQRLVLCRPAVEAGEHLGFLPGDFQAKVNPYLRPLYDALFNLLDVNQVRRLIDSDVIEIAPLAYMRGRTLEKAFIILDEAQNTTPGQMKMFLTRMGKGSKVVVTGDVTQIDLPKNTNSGLKEAIELLADVEGISVVHLGRRDIVRHPLVQRIVQAYAKQEGQGDSP